MMRELWALLDPETSMLTHESGASRDIQSVFYESGPPRSYLGWGQSSQLGFSLGLAMGAKLANPEKLVVNVMGDASVGMTGMDWETASRNDIPILTVIKHDSIFSGYDRNIPEASERYRANRQQGDYGTIAQEPRLPCRDGDRAGGAPARAGARHPRHARRPARGGRRHHGRDQKTLPPRPDLGRIELVSNSHNHDGPNVTHLSLSLSTLKGGEGTQAAPTFLPLLPPGEASVGVRRGFPGRAEGECSAHLRLWPGGGTAVGGPEALRLGFAA